MCIKFELQMWMNVLETLIYVMTMQLATIVQGVTPALATLDTQATVSLAQVLKYLKQNFNLSSKPWKMDE